MKEFSKVRKLITRGALAGASAVTVADPAIADGGDLASQISDQAAEVVSSPAAPQVVYSAEEPALAELNLSIKRTSSEPWNEIAQQRFRDLAKKDALTGLTAAEEVEMGLLQRARETAVAPRSFEEIKNDLELQELVAKVVVNLEELINRVTTKHYNR